MNKKIALPILLSTSAALLAACGGNSSNATKDRVVQGTVDGFGSVIVDGVHYKSTRTEFEIDDTSGSESQLRVGQVVTVIGSDDGAEGVATRIIYDADIKGQVTAVDAAAGELEVLGQLIITNDMTVFSDLDLATLQVGQMIELSGYRNGQGQLIATFIEAEDSAESEIKGLISNLNTTDKTFTIEGLAIDYSSTATLEISAAELSNGMLVEVEGQLQGNTLIASEIEQEDLHHESEDGVEVDLSGYITSLDLEANTFVIGNTTIVLNEETEFEDASLQQLALNTFVSVEGTFNELGQLVAEEIGFEDSIALELSGPVTAVNGNLISVMGIEVAVDTLTRIKDDRDDLQYFNAADIQVGDFVEVRATENSDGSYHALRLERDDAEDSVEISGTINIELLASGTISIAGVSIDVSAIQNTSILLADAYLEVEGTFDGELITATDVELDD